MSSDFLFWRRSVVIRCYNSVMTETSVYTFYSHGTDESKSQTRQLRLGPINYIYISTI